jgi:hypothetical protein
MPALTAIGFVLAIHLLEWAPLWTFMAFSRLSRLDATRADEVLSRLDESRIGLVRTMMIGMRGVILSTWFDQAAVHEALDYEPAAFMRERIALRSRIVGGGEAGSSDRIGPFSKEAAS